MPYQQRNMQEIWPIEQIIATKREHINKTSRHWSQHSERTEKMWTVIYLFCVQRSTRKRYREVKKHIPKRITKENILENTKQTKSDSKSPLPWESHIFSAKPPHNTFRLPTLRLKPCIQSQMKRKEKNRDAFDRILKI